VLGKPDVVIEMPVEFDVPAEGVIPYKYFTVPTNFTEDKRARGEEIRAVVGRRSMVARYPGARTPSHFPLPTT